MQRAIIRFSLDAEGDWRAHLECGHRQHVRHRPPFQERAWVEDPSGRASRIGAPLECPLCDRAELPEGLALVRTAGPWTEGTLPAALLGEHRVAAGRWGNLRVLSGAVRFVLAGDPATVELVEAGEAHGIPPDAPHRLEPLGPVRLAIDFLRVPSVSLGPDGEEADVEGSNVEGSEMDENEMDENEMDGNAMNGREALEALEADEELGGDPACWASRVCEECGAFVGQGPHRPGCTALSREVT